MIKKFPLYPRRQVISLDGIWDFVFSENADYDLPELEKIKFTDRIAVPGVWDALPAWNGKRGIGFFRTWLEIPSGRHSRLTIGALGLYGKVFVDGKLTGEHNSPYVPFSVDLEVAESSRRELVVMVCNRFDYKRCPLFEMSFDFYAYGGIFREVQLQILPDCALLDRVGIDTIDWKTGRIRVTVTAASPETREITLCGENSNILLTEPRDFANGREVFELNLPDSKPWSPASPALHQLTVDTGEDAITVRFGIRQIRTENGHIYLNDQPIPKLLGYCRHESHPQYGPALPAAQLVADIQLLRELGCNFVRGSHYPQDPRFLALCDEYGLLMWEESLGWQPQARHFADPAFVEAQLQHTSAMIRASYNNPSVIMRGFLNEGDSKLEDARPCYEALIHLIRTEDPSRLVSYASSHDLNDLFLEEIDVISFNTYPGWYWYGRDPENEQPLDEIVPCLRNYVEGLQKRGLGGKPFIISEIGAGAIYGWRDPICAHWSEEYQSEYLRIAIEEIIANPAIAGVALWQFCDSRTFRGFRALARPRSFNNKGILDEYRRPKMAYQTVKKLFAVTGEI